MAEFVVTTLEDETVSQDPNTGAPTGNLASETADGDGLSLREAIGLAANGDTVVFEDGLAGTIRIDGGSGAIGIDADITIYGDDRITISGDSAGDDTVVNGVTDLATTAASELDDNQRIFELVGGLSNVVLDGLTITGGRGENYGGAIDTVTSNLTVTGSTFAGNVVYGGKGGGAIYSYGYLSVRDSTFFGNIASGTDNGGANGGGAIFSYSGSLSVVNSTFVGNQALLGVNSGAPSGGAIFANGTPAGDVYLNNVTMTGNRADAQGGGLFANNGSGDVIITNSVILGNKANVTVDSFGNEIDGFDAPAFDIANSITDGDNAGDVFAQTETVNGRDAGVLADNAGPVQTVALKADPANPALNSGGANARSGDARGIDGFGQRDLGSYQTVSDQNLVVTLLDDGVSAIDGGVTLREAVLAANARDGADTITFAEGLTGLIRLTDGEIEITEAVTIQGGGEITISGDAAGDDDLDGYITNVAASETADVLGDNTRVLNATADLSLDGLTITGGRVTADQADGGGVLVSGGDLTILNSVIAGNSAAGEFSNGGGAFVDGDLTITDSTIRNNSAAGGDTDGDTYDANVANYGGGGIYTTGSATIAGSSIADNETTGIAGRGAGVKAQGDITITSSTVANNRAAGEKANGAGLYSAGEVTATNSTFVGNRAYNFDSSGGAIYAGTDVTLTHVTITGNGVTNSANTGGGVYFKGQATVTNSIILGNNSSFGGGDLDKNANTAGPDDVTFTGQNIVGATSDDFNTAGFTNVVNAAADTVFKDLGFFEESFGLLADNGGPVLTAALFGSPFNPALDAATTTGTDARGEARVDLAGVNNGGVADLGAFEFQPDEDTTAPIFDSVPFISVGETLLSGLNFTPVTAVDLTALTFSIDDGPDAGAVSIDPMTGVLSFNGPIDFENPSSADGDNRFEVTVKATDQGGNSATDDITIDIDNVNEAPVAAAGVASGDEDTVISGTLSATDVDSATLTFSLLNGPSNGAVAVNANGSFQFTPVADFNGTDSFTFNVSDGELSDTGTATITVNPVDEPFDPNVPTNGDDRIFGTDEADIIRALGGDDTVIGRAGDDSLFGSAGNDSIKGSAGDDRIRGNVGDDSLKGNGGEDDINGGGGADDIRGGGAADVINGGGGADTIRGNGGADQINGAGGADLLLGGGGADTLTGRGGDDTLQGNNGADVFQFRASDRNDTILDFRQGQDQIEITTGANAFARLDIQQDGADVLISFGTGQVRVITDDANAFDEDDFIF